MSSGMQAIGLFAIQDYQKRHLIIHRCSLFPHLKSIHYVQHSFCGTGNPMPSKCISLTIHNYNETVSTVTFYTDES